MPSTSSVLLGEEAGNGDNQDGDGQTAAGLFGSGGASNFELGDISVAVDEEPEPVDADEEPEPLAQSYFPVDTPAAEPS